MPPVERPSGPGPTLTGHFTATAGPVRIAMADAEREAISSVQCIIYNRPLLI